MKRSEIEANLDRGMWPATGGGWVQDKVGLVIDTTSFDIHGPEHSGRFRWHCLYAGKHGVREFAQDRVSVQDLLDWGLVWKKYFKDFDAKEYVAFMKDFEFRGTAAYICYFLGEKPLGITSMLIVDRFACFLQFFWDKSNRDLRRLNLGYHNIYRQILLCRQRGVRYLLLRGTKEHKLRFKPRLVNFNKGETICRTI